MVCHLPLEEPDDRHFEVYGAEDTVLSNVIDKIVDFQKWGGIELCESVNHL